ncbi:MAG: GxxExxY protein [Patescibacteria group bacterium]
MLETKTKLLYGKLSYDLTGILFSVHNELGSFAREKQYADLIEKKLKDKSIQYQRECQVGDTGNTLDFIIDRSIILELKSKPNLLRADYEQIKRYLQICDLKLGILVNFRPKFLQPKRVLNK